MKRSGHKALILHTPNGYAGAEHTLLGFLSRTRQGRCYSIVLPFGDSLGQVLVDRGYKVHFLPLEYPRRNSVGWRLLPFLLNMIYVSIRLLVICRKEHIGTIYCHTHKSLPYILFPWLFSIRIICAVRDNLSTKVEGCLLRRFSNCRIFVSGYLASQFEVWSGVHVIENGICFPQDTPAPNLRESYSLAPECKLVGMIGTILPWKNQKEFLAAAELLVSYQVPVHFFIIGSTGDVRYAEELICMLRQSGMQNHVSFTGYMPAAKGVIEQLDVLVHTAIGEPFGRVIAESMLLGTPVVAYRNAGADELVSDDVTGLLVATHDIQAVAIAVNRLLTDPTLCNRLRCQAQCVAGIRFDMDVYVAKMEALILQ